jgi:hypothetical protein
MRDCRTFVKLQEAMELSQAANGALPPSYNKGTVNQGYPIHSGQSNSQSKVYISAMIQHVPKSKKEHKSISTQVNLAISSPPATTEYLRWSEQTVGFSREDHQRKVPRPGHAPMVLKAQIGGYDVGRVFMDAGSSINLIYARSLKAMNISLEWLQPTNCFFHRIVPGSANHPQGRIELDVCFSDKGNFQIEKLEFEVMDWPSQYHAILGQPAFVRFMAVPHYAYLVLKIPGPRGVIMIKRSFEVSDTCNKEFNKMAQTFSMTTE